MEIIKLRLDQLKPYEKNAKRHTDEQIQHIINSIEQFGMNDPIGIWGEKNVIVEGHGRYFALKKMGVKEVDCIRLDHLSDEERKAYTLVHNQATLETPFDDDLLKIELDGIFDIDMSEFGFRVATEIEDNNSEGEYTKKTEVPQYDVKGDDVPLEQLVDREKALALIEEIEGSNVSEEEKTFLKLAARRHYVFNYKKIAEYYAAASEEMQELMEKSALVIIDYNNAIANGYIKLSKKLEELRIGDA